MADEKNFWAKKKWHKKMKYENELIIIHNLILKEIRKSKI